MAAITVVANVLIACTLVALAAGSTLHSMIDFKKVEGRRNKATDRRRRMRQQLSVR